MPEPLLTLNLNYFNPLFAAPSHTGNIAEQSWFEGGELSAEQTIHAYAYDKLNRLVDAQQYAGQFQSQGHGTFEITCQLQNTYTERNISYDLNGIGLSFR